MDPATAVVLIVAILAGFGAGVGASGVAGQRAATKAIESNSAQLETVLDGQTALLELGGVDPERFLPGVQPLRAFLRS